MVELKVFDETGSPLKSIYLELIDEYGPLLVVVDKNGKRLPGGRILRITQNGFYPIEQVNPMSGLPLDEERLAVKMECR